VESLAHRKLKRLAVAFLREHGCLAAAAEVRCPISRYRVDVAGYVDKLPTDRPALAHEGECSADPHRPFARCAARTVMIECKQSRPDFLRDRRDRERLLRERRELDHLRLTIEERRIKRLEPELRRDGSALFPELEDWDFADSRLPGYHRVLRRLRRLDALLHGETKFCMIARYMLADRLYIAAPQGMLKPRELPPGWGLLECPPRALRNADPNANLFGDSVLRVAVKAPALRPRMDFRERMLRNIAVAASAAASRSMGILA
jgi:hypothetical protein